VNLLGFLKSAPKVVDSVFDKDNGHLANLGSWIGNQQFTPQEQAISNQKTIESVQNYSIATLNESTDRSKTRRTLAVEWFRMQIWLIKLNVLCIFIDTFAGIFDKELGLTQSIAVVAFSGLLWGVTSGIGLFFWGTHSLRSSKFSGGDK